MYPLLQTQRLILTPLALADTIEAHSLWTDPAVFATMEDAPTTQENFTCIFDQCIANANYFTIREKSTNCFIGNIGLHQYINKLKATIRHSQTWAMLLPEYQNKGYCTEALTELVNFAMHGVRTPRIYANQFHHNPAAASVLKNCGFSYHRTYKMNDVPYDQYLIERKDYLKTNTAEKAYDYNSNISPSPYSTENPIRKIDSIAYIKEPTGYLCGQSCIAMLAGVSVDEVIDVMETDKGTSGAEVGYALKYYGIAHAKSRAAYEQGTPLPECCLLGIKLPKYGHWSLYFKGKYYDPEFGVMDCLPQNAVLRNYWEIYI